MLFVAVGVPPLLLGLLLLMDRYEERMFRPVRAARHARHARRRGHLWLVPRTGPAEPSAGRERPGTEAA
ncbi:hypothetical protein ACFYP4_21320 [Streptomyces sp. NPDC005551]|uniref:hypothetical protein n=1 Tax=Streptomyces sp. NPDC005551 TaxID=3364725 RepID=UPI003679B457